MNINLEPLEITGFRGHYARNKISDKDYGLVLDVCRRSRASDKDPICYSFRSYQDGKFVHRHFYEERFPEVETYSRSPTIDEIIETMNSLRLEVVRAETEFAEDLSYFVCVLARRAYRDFMMLVSELLPMYDLETEWNVNFIWCSHLLGTM